MIITRLQGGMGNQMFQYAAGHALSIHYDVPLALDTTFLKNQTAIRIVRPNFVPRKFDLGHFAIQAEIANKKDIPWYGRPFLRGVIMQGIDALLRKVPLLPGWERQFSYNEGFFNLGPNAYLAGFWQSPKYFDSIADTIRKDFTSTAPLPAEAQALKEVIGSKRSLCIHIRRDDFGAGTFHGVVPLSYYREAILLLKKERVVEHIYVFSRDIEWCKEHFAFAAGEATYLCEEDKMQFELMRACTHFIISNSTYAWWAAWLGEATDKLVIAPKQWFRNTSHDTSDLFPPEWILL